VTAVESIQIAIGVFQALATVLISVVLYRQAQSLKRVEIHNQAIQAYNLLNSVAVSSPEVLAAFDTLGRPDSPDDDSTRRRRWCAFIWLEALQVAYTALKSRMIDERYAEQALRQQLEVILKDDLVYWLVLHRGFDPRFAEYCTDIRRRVPPHRPVQFSEDEAIRGVIAKGPNTPMQPTGSSSG
jgi:hypothetical protein